MSRCMLGLRTVQPTVYCCYIRVSSGFESRY